MVNFGTHTSTGLCTPREPLLKLLLNSLCILCMNSADIFDLTIILLEFIASYRLGWFTYTFHLTKASETIHPDWGQILALGRLRKIILPCCIHVWCACNRSCHRVRVCIGPRLGHDSMCLHPCWDRDKNLHVSNAYYDKFCYHGWSVCENTTRC